MQNDDFKKKYFDKYEEVHGYRYPVQSPNNKFGGTISKPQKRVNEYLSSIDIETKMEHSIYPFRVDIVVKESNKVIEIFGDYWHANPIKYKETDAIKFPKQTNITLVKTIWERDERRLSYIKEAGFDVLVIWEYEINKEFEIVKEKIKSFLNL
jgi:G:T-mismatch repair DNA endonuclease (very short patch repair protein)